MLGVIDCGLGNIGSVIRIVEKAGGKALRVKSESELSNVTKIILPGVGSFDKGISAINNSGIKDLLLEKVALDGVPILGICLGMQLLCQKSEEGVLPGLCLIDAIVKKIPSDNNNLKIPHMGWNSVDVVRKNTIMEMSQDELRFYFVHSYYVDPLCKEIEIAITEYGNRFCAAFQNKNIFGVQFHPEKSHEFGLNLIKNFLNL